MSSSVRPIGLGERIGRVFSLMPSLAAREVRIRYRTGVLDVAWAVVTPVVVLLVYGLVLTRSFAVNTMCGSYLSSAWVGLVIWTVFAAGVGHAVSSLIAASDLVTKVYFPREAIPLGVVGSTMLDLVIGVGSLLVLVIVQGDGVPPAAITALLPLAVLVTWTAATSVLVAVAAVFVRDVVHAVHLALRVGFFATPVMYEAHFIPDAIGWTSWLSPLAVSITGMREAVLCGEVPDIQLLGMHLVVGLAMLGGAILFTRRVESRMADVV